MNPLLEKYYGFLLIILCASFAVLIIEAYAIPTPKQPFAVPSPSQTSFITSTSPSPTSSSHTYSTKPTDPPIFLNITSAPPDELEISQVSGFYGPGAWIAWMLWIVASWYRIFADHASGVDPNAWSYLVATNVAAIDLMRRAQRMVTSARHTADGRPDLNLLGSFGAAATIVWQGTAHAFIQGGLTLILDERASPKFWTLLAGLFLPLLSQALVSTAMLEISTLSDLTPAMFWNGMGSGYHQFLLCVHVLWVPVFMILAIVLGNLFFRYCARKTVFNPIDFNRIFKLLYHYYPALMLTALDAFMVGLCVILLLPADQGLGAFDVVLYFFFATLLPPAGILVPACIMYLFYPFHALITFLKIVFTGGKSFKKACFFMPCAPQSLLDMDQVVGVLIGLIMFVGIEIGVPMYRKWQKRKREDRILAQDISRRIERARAVDQDHGIELTTSANRTNSELQALSRRTNSGLSRQVA